MRPIDFTAAPPRSRGPDIRKSRHRPRTAARRPSGSAEPSGLIPTRTERHVLAQSRRLMGMTRYSLRSENPGMGQPSRGLVLVEAIGELLGKALGLDQLEIRSTSIPKYTFPALPDYA